MNTSLLKLPLEAVGVTATASPIMATDFLILLWSMLNTIPVTFDVVVDSRYSKADESSRTLRKRCSTRANSHILLW